MMHRILSVLFVALIFVGLGRVAFGQEEEQEEKIPSADLRAGKDEQKRYFLLGPRQEDGDGKEGLGLLVVMPGGPGTADFHPFVTNIYRYAVPKGYLVAQPVAVKWTEDQEVVWPTKSSGVPKAKFTTEEFVAMVIDEVAEKHKIDPAKVFTLSWSSSGPAAYAISLSSKQVRGSLIAMSVFKPDGLPPLKNAEGHRYYLFHSPDDRVCPFRMAKDAEAKLKAHKADVTLATYEGGHGWRAGLYEEMRKGLEWLEESSQKAEVRRQK